MKTTLTCCLICGALVIAFVFRKRIFPPLMRHSHSKEEMVTRSQISYFGKALNSYYSDFHRVPTGNIQQVFFVLAGSNVLGQNPSNKIFFSHPNTQYFKLGDFEGLVDGWGSSLKYNVSNNSFVLYSFGRNKMDDGGKGDDISYAGRSQLAP
jgi:hypothetical protein